MTLVGKIFTVLILLMSGFFMIMATMVFATHKNWKEAVTDPTTGFAVKLNSQIALNKQLTEQLQSYKTELATQMAARRQAIAALQSNLAVKTRELESRQKELETLSASHNTMVKNEELAQQRLKSIEEEVAKIRVEVRDAQTDRDMQFDKVVKLTDDLHQAELTKKLMEERNGQLLNQVAAQKLVMDQHGLTVNSLTDSIPPQVDGIVVAVSDKDLIEISLGSDDGLKEGHSMEIYRGNQYLGRVIIRKTSPDRAVGQVVKQLQKGTIKKGDNVTTKLS